MWAQLLIALAIAAAAAGGTFKLTVDHFHGVIAEKQVELDKQLAAANVKAEQAAIDWQAWAEVQPAKIVYRDRRISDAFKADPVWAAASIPAAVRVQLDVAARGADPAASQPDGSVSAAAAAPVSDERGFGGSLLIGARRIRELFSSPPSTGASGAAGS